MVLVLVPAMSRAQSADPKVMATVQSLFDQAVEEMGKKNYASACPKLEQATQMLPEAIGAKETLAQCYEGQGRLASAWAQYGLVESLASRASQAKRASDAAAKAAALKPKLATLTVDVPGEVRGLSELVITRDGIALREALWGTALPVDTGEHVIEVKAAGRRPWSGKVQIDADGVQGRVTVPKLEAEAAAQEPPPPPVETPADKPVEAAPRPWQKPVGIAAIALGAVGLGTSGILAGLAVGKRNESNADGHCDAQNTCDETGLDLRRQAVGLGNGATAALVVGGVLAAGGVVLLITAPSRKDAAEKTGMVRWGIDVSPARIGVRGAW
jgi:hypothetical protein